jgi:hypothetical protein
VVWF